MPPTSFGGTLDILAKEDSAPLAFIEKERPQGLAVEVVAAIQERIKSKEKIYTVPWSRGYQSLQNKANVVFFTVAKSAEREGLFTMIGPVATTEIGIYAKESNSASIKTEKDLENQKIAVRYDTIYETALKTRGLKNIFTTSSIQQNAQLLSAGRVDLLCDSSVELEGVLKHEKLPIAKFKKALVLETIDLYIAFSKGTPHLTIDAWYEALRDIKKDKTFSKIYKKWLPNDKPPLQTEMLGISSVKNTQYIYQTTLN